MPIHTAVISLIQQSDKFAHRWEVQQLARWCCHHSVELNTLKDPQQSHWSQQSCVYCRNLQVSRIHTPENWSGRPTEVDTGRRMAVWISRSTCPPSAESRNVADHHTLHTTCSKFSSLMLQSETIRHTLCLHSTLMHLWSNIYIHVST